MVVASAGHAATWSTRAAAPFPALSAPGERQDACSVLRNGTHSKNVSITKPSNPALAQTAQLRQGGVSWGYWELEQKDLC